ncbi:MgtC/SapB family protein [Aliarcobacter cryaerophilus]|uniref:MgtC/SapB family protein n=1 Tax=Aliarcobacter cryaerophilus TaxID=28198 RepID=UPI003BB13F05
MQIHELLLHILPVLIFSFIIGLEVRAYLTKFHENDARVFFGTTRTYAFLGILGFILYEIEPKNFSLFIVGFLSITFLYSILYKKMLDTDKNSILLYIVSIIVYSFGPLIGIFPLWISALIFVLVIFLLNSKNRILTFHPKINIYELETFGKIILLSAVVLPLLPTDNNIPYLGISLYKIWLTVVVISTISYISYLVQKYIFPSKGVLLTGILGGAYSSTATTVVLSKKAQAVEDTNMFTASIMSATFMMYLRLIIIAAIFNFEVLKVIVTPYIVFGFITLIISFVYYKKATNETSKIETEDRNPLELGTAFVFAILFIVTMFITNFVVNNYGTTGLNILSFIIGMTDIDPFILALLTGKYNIDAVAVASAMLIATGSNNILKALYAVWFGKKKAVSSAFWLIILGFLTIGFGIYI